MNEALLANARDLESEIAWFARVLDARFKLYFGEDAGVSDVLEIVPPDLNGSDSGYAGFLRHYRVTLVERVAVVLSLIPHVRPQLLDVFHTRNKTFDRRFTEFGGVRDAQGDFLPTGETLAFLLGGTRLDVRFSVPSLFDREHYFRRHGILRLVTSSKDDPFLKGVLRLSDEYVGLLTSGHGRRPELSADFPARHIETKLEWQDLVLHPATLRQVREIEVWIRHGETLMKEWEMASKLRPGHRALFYGPPGTGKTITACLLGRSTGCEVYKVDLSLVVSKYIGETEKNLSQVFDQAQNKGWILFFDEADALFGKRSETRDSHDRYANQEVSYLLQRIETFDGLAILASNQRDNMDEAFTRRFESIIYFPLPRSEERLRLWRQGLPAKARLDAGLDLDRIAADHALSGGSIMNIVRFAALQALEEGTGTITQETLLQGIRREYAKEGKGS